MNRLIRIKANLRCTAVLFKGVQRSVECHVVWNRKPSLRRRRVHSEDAVDSVRLKSSCSGYFSTVTTLCPPCEVLLNDSRNVNEVSKKLLEIEEAFSRFEKAHYDYVWRS